VKQNSDTYKLKLCFDIHAAHFHVKLVK